MLQSRNNVENAEIKQTAAIWQQQSAPSTPPGGSWRSTSKNMMCGMRNEKPWLYVELQCQDHDKGWRANLQEVNLNKSYANRDGNLVEE